MQASILHSWDSIGHAIDLIVLNSAYMYAQWREKLIFLISSAPVQTLLRQQKLSVAVHKLKCSHYVIGLNFLIRLSLIERKLPRSFKLRGSFHS